MENKNKQNQMKVIGKAMKLKKYLSILLLAFIQIVAANQAYAAENITFYHYDLLGSPIVTTNEIGEVVWREEYSPYGEKLLNQDGPSDNVRGYTGHVFDKETGLNYMQARYYDPEIGRFMGIDPVGFKKVNPIMFNRYAYANNNPYKYKDPNGEYAELGIEAISISLGLSSLAANIANNNYTAAAVDAIGVVADVLGALAPGVPGVVGLGIKASREATEKGIKKGRGNIGHFGDFDKAREDAFKQAGLTDPDNVKFSKFDKRTGTVVEFKGKKGQKVAYDSPHQDLDATKGHDKNHVGWQSGGKQPNGGHRGNNTYDGPDHPSRGSDKGDLDD